MPPETDRRPRSATGSRTRWRLALGLLALLPPGDAAAQAVLLRFRPAVGGRVQTVADTRVLSLVFGLPSLPDSTQIESTWRTVETARVLSETGGRYRLGLRFDSSRVRARAGTDNRADVNLPGVEGMRVELTMGPRLDVSTVIPPSAGADSGFIGALRARLGGLQFNLPDTIVVVGETWHSPIQFPVGAYLTTTGRLSSAQVSRGTAAITLDSLRARGSDTLLYLSVDAPLEQSSGWIAGEGGVGTATFRGRIAAALLWSTSWNAVVAATTTGRMELQYRLNRGTDGLAEGTVTLNLSRRHRVQL